VTARSWRADAPGVSVPVCRPKLPEADRILPYLRAIDESRWYSNHGPLCRRLEERLAEHCGAASGAHVVLATNATAAMTAALLALGAQPGSLCMMPAWTFAASGHAAVRAGLVPWFADVDERDGTLQPEAALELAARAPGRLGAVLVVSPFGLPIALDGWRAFRERTGIPVVLDAAAGFDTVRASDVPAVVSLHATKAIGIGEGAFAVCADPRAAERIRQRVNFGFAGSREALVSAMNAKLSEYAAAVGLAALDAWPAARSAYRAVALRYADAFAAPAGPRTQRGYGSEWISATTIVRLPPRCLEAVEDALAAAGFASRRWWGDGLAAQAAFAGAPRAPLPVTGEFAASTIGLPCWPDLPPALIDEVARLTARACAGVEPVVS
jgi:dTDP-4-amino-4,6-dideoxygalactose transaminase